MALALLAGVVLALLIVSTTDRPGDPGPGGPAAGFGTEGVSHQLIGSEGGANAIAVQPDGRIVLAGKAVVGGKAVFAITRYLDDGRLDSDFGAAGVVTVPIGSAAAANSVIAQPGGRILVAGAAVVEGRMDFAAVRLTEGGEIDTGFGDRGMAVHPLALAGIAMAAGIQPDGRIVLGGIAKVLDDPAATERLETTAFGAMRLLPDGRIDRTFGDRGTATIAAPGEAQAMAIEPDGDVVLAGEVLEDGHRALAAARLTSGGVPDHTFGAAGVVRMPVGSGSVATGVALDRGGIVLVGSAFTDRFLTAAVRLDAEGRPDRDFGVDGIATADTGTVANGVARQADGHFVVAGTGGLSAVRIAPDGSLDDGFGEEGVAVIRSGSTSAANGVVALSDGSILLGGTAEHDGRMCFAVAKLAGSPR